MKADKKLSRILGTGCIKPILSSLLIILKLFAECLGNTELIILDLFRAFSELINQLVKFWSFFSQKKFTKEIQNDENRKITTFFIEQIVILFPIFLVSFPGVKIQIKDLSFSGFVIFYIVCTFLPGKALNVTNFLIEVLKSIYLEVKLKKRTITLN